MGADDILTEALVLSGIGLRDAKDYGFKVTFSDEPLGPGTFTADLLGPSDVTYSLTVSDLRKEYGDVAVLDIDEQPTWLDSPELDPKTPVVFGLKGNDYQVRETGSVGWLCPALFKYFDEAPQTLYFTTEEMTDDDRKEAEARSYPRGGKVGDSDGPLALLGAGSGTSS
jgi:hypothetical protein